MKRLILFFLFAALLPACAVELSSDATVVNSDGVLVVSAEKPRGVAFNASPVERGQAYLLTFEAKATGQPLIENNPRAHVARYENSRLFWRWRFEFHNAEHQSCGQIGYSHMTVFSSAWRTYKDVFYAPEDAGSVTLAFFPPGVPVALEMRNVKLEPYDRGGVVNVNGDFALGEACLAGWGSPLDGGDFRTVDGKYVYDTAYGSESARFPLDDRLAYRLTVKRTTYGGYAAANIYLHGGETRLKMFAVPKSGTIDFAVPAGTTSGYFKIYNSYLESAILIPLGPKEMLKGDR